MYHVQLRAKPGLSGHNGLRLERAYENSQGDIFFRHQGDFCAVVCNRHIRKASILKNRAYVS